MLIVDDKVIKNVILIHKPQTQSSLELWCRRNGVVNGTVEQWKSGVPISTE